jgi:hypothetical protein
MPILIILLVLAVLLLFLASRQIYYLSSDLVRDKDFFPHIHPSTKPLDEAPPGLPFSQFEGTINDVTGVNRTAILLLKDCQSSKIQQLRLLVSLLSI